MTKQISTVTCDDVIILIPNSEMPTSRDLKSGDCLFLPPPPLPPKKKIDPAPNGNDLGHYMMSHIMYILSKFEC